MPPELPLQTRDDARVNPSELTTELDHHCRLAAWPPGRLVPKCGSIAGGLAEPEPNDGAFGEQDSRSLPIHFAGGGQGAVASD